MGRTIRTKLALNPDELFAPKQLFVLLSNLFEKNDYIKQVKVRAEAKSSLFVFESTNIAFIMAEVARFHAGALFFCVRNERDFEMVKKALGELKELIQDRRIHALGVCDLKDASASESLIQMGAAVFPLSLEWRDLEKKIDVSCEVLKTQYPESIQTDLPATKELKVSMRAPNTENDRQIEVTPLEFGDEELVLDAQSGVFSQGQEVILTMNNGLPGSLTQITKIASVEGGRDLVSVALSSDLALQFYSVKAAQIRAQLHVTNFLKDVRGW